VASRMLFVNIPVSDLGRSVEFFTALGFSFDPRFTDDGATCMVISEQAFAMIMTRERFAEFTPKPVADPATATGAILALSAESREEVDRIADTAVANGGVPVGEPTDHGWMYYRAFDDPDGHMWEIAWMDPSAAEG
jgi:uncharacterized protein